MCAGPALTTRRRARSTEGWERQYRIVSDVPYEAVDNIRSNKRSLMFGNVLITSGSIQDSQNEHLRAAALYVEKVQTAANGN